MQLAQGFPYILLSTLLTLPVKTLTLCNSPHAATEHVIGTTLEDMFDHLIRLHTWKTVFGIKTAATATKTPTFGSRQYSQTFVITY